MRFLRPAAVRKAGTTDANVASNRKSALFILNTISSAQLDRYNTVRLREKKAGKIADFKFFGGGVEVFFFSPLV